MAEELIGKTILVTGAGDGIGRVAALTFAQEGANVILLGRTRSKLEAVNDEIRATTPTDPTIVPFDLVNLDEANRIEFQESFEKQFERLDGLLHNASILGPKVPIEYYPASSWAEVMQVNVTAPFLLTQALIPLLKKPENASIVFTSSGVGLRGRAYWGAYAVSKFATEGTMEVLADELTSTSGIRVNSLNPGGTRTSMRAAAYPAEDPATLPAPIDHMPLYVYLMSDSSIGVTGRKFDPKSWHSEISRSNSDQDRV